MKSEFSFETATYKSVLCNYKCEGMGENFSDEINHVENIQNSDTDFSKRISCVCTNFSTREEHKRGLTRPLVCLSEIVCVQRNQEKLTHCCFGQNLNVG